MINGHGTFASWRIQRHLPRKCSVEIDQQRSAVQWPWSSVEPPTVISWFIIPSKYGYNYQKPYSYYSYCSFLHQLNAIVSNGGPTSCTCWYRLVRGCCWQFSLRLVTQVFGSACSVAYNRASWPWWAGGDIRCLPQIRFVHFVDAIREQRYFYHCVERERERENELQT